jgi:hypothetical protein
MWGAAMVAAALACAPQGDHRSDSQDRHLMEQGRLYTNWLYGNEYQKLWDRFSPEMRQTFGSVTDLASFLGRAVTRLGAEKGVVDERVESSDALRVYRRAAAFDKSQQRMLIEWSVAKDGAVTGLVMRPETQDSK